MVMVKLDGKLTQPITYETGIRQGDFLRPLFFILIMKENIKKVKKRENIK